MSEDEDEALLMGLAMGGDDGLAISLMNEDKHNRWEKDRVLSANHESASKTARVVQVIAILSFLAIIFWMLTLIV